MVYNIYQLLFQPDKKAIKFIKINPEKSFD